MKDLRRFIARCLMAYLFCYVANLTEAGPPSQPQDFAGLAFLAGGVWQGDLDANGNASATKIEMEFNWSPNHRTLRFDSFFVRGANRRPYSSGLYAWDPVAQQLRIVYSDEEGNLSEGPVAVEDGALVHNLTVQQADGTTTSVRARLESLAPNSFTNTIFVAKNGSWTKLVAVVYHRRDNRGN